MNNLKNKVLKLWPKSKNLKNKKINCKKNLFYILYFQSYEKFMYIF